MNRGGARREFAAVIIDSRPIEAEVVHQHLRLLDLPRWRLYVYSSVRPSLSFDYVWTPYTYTGIGQYNWTLAGRRFWTRFSAFRRVLVFQQDSGLLRRGMEEFCKLPYDYIGAPWKPEVKWAPRGDLGGNGGLSLRNPRQALWTTWRHPYRSDYGAEDVYFTRFVRNPAPRDICAAFSCETIKITNDDPLPLGWHAYDKYHGSAALAGLRARAQSGVLGRVG